MSNFEQTSSELRAFIGLIGDFLSALDQSITIIDTQGCFVYYNEQAGELDSTRPELMLGKPLLDVCPSLTEKSSTLMRCVLKGERFINFHQQYSNPAGRLIDYLHTALPICNSGGKIIGAIEIGRDLSKVRALTDQVLELSAKLYVKNTEDNKDEEIITTNPEMLRQIRHLDACASTDVPILIYGETGTGKELFARRAHYRSKRANFQLFTLNCAAIPESLLESTLFGTTRGAFTGAENRKGLLALANDSTLFLDELNSMPLQLQGKLLRVLQDGCFTPLGSQKQETVDLRLIAALNNPPQEEIKNGRLREDLYYRLNVGYIFIPPLRERQADISLLANHFIHQYAPEIQPSIKGLSMTALQDLNSSSWPGNVRMLENIIQRSLLLSERNVVMLEQIQFMNELDEEQTQKKETDKFADITGEEKTLPQCLADYESYIIESELSKCEGNITATAKALGIPRTTLQSKMKKYRLENKKLNIEY